VLRTLYRRGMLNWGFLLFTDILKLNKLNLNSHNPQLLPSLESFEESIFLLHLSSTKT
jgi:hypothetical protein